MDASFKFNVPKRRDYLIRTRFSQLTTKSHTIQSKTSGVQQTLVSTAAVVEPHIDLTSHHAEQNEQPSLDMRMPNQDGFVSMFEDMHEFFKKHNEW